MMTCNQVHWTSDQWISWITFEPSCQAKINTKHRSVELDKHPETRRMWLLSKNMHKGTAYKRATPANTDTLTSQPLPSHTRTHTQKCTQCLWPSSDLTASRALQQWLRNHPEPLATRLLVTAWWRRGGGNNLGRAEGENEGPLRQRKGGDGHPDDGWCWRNEPQTCSSGCEMEWRGRSLWFQSSYS